MKVLAINGSPHKEGTTYTAIRLVADELEKQGVEVEIVHVGNKSIRGCTACGTCRATRSHRCVYNDIVNECLEKVETADGILLASPVYYSGIAGTMKSFLDRFFYAVPALQYKAGGAVVALRRSGAVDTFHQLNNYLNLSNVVITPSQYWNAVHGLSGEQAMHDEEGVEIMKTLGKNMAWLIKSLEYSKQEINLPK